MKITIEDKTTGKLLFSTESSTIKTDKPEDKPIDLMQITKFIEIFNDRIENDKYGDAEIQKLWDEGYTVLSGNSSMAKSYLVNVGHVKVDGFEVPKVDKLISLNEKYIKDCVESDEKDHVKEKLNVIESDGDDYTLVDRNGKIYIYEGKSNKMIEDGTDIYTHIAKHLMSRIVGKEYEY